ncbi:hypothetical protein GAO09_16765 [Rhizobiales bacterium RZME27]|uniref:Uncharacterized protein n=1 Tax=Endobacterium cereale TaxID=2663029 RepID=A0A6A8AD91_9HYPH|nr:hypothetical protein [Endobacterium cereale]MEB2846891.1 hypothetical protein [Endobacterium cereale]MQY47690.1 hypothetical protein [Endobacterium cereale]
MMNSFDRSKISVNPAKSEASEAGFEGIRKLGEWSSLLENGSEEGRLLAIAYDYTSSLRWMKKNRGCWHGLTVGGLCGVFLFRIEAYNKVPEYHWVVVGQKWPYPKWNDQKVDENAVANATYAGLPHAYIWTGMPPEFPGADCSPDPLTALEAYVGVIQDWIDAVRADGDLTEVFPVEVPANRSAVEYAGDVERLLLRIQRELIAG